MTPLDPAELRAVIDQFANALQAAVLLAEHLQRATSASAQDATAITRSLERVTDALETLQRRMRA